LGSAAQIGNHVQAEMPGDDSVKGFRQWMPPSRAG
jgi:hypothetical protein